MTVCIAALCENGRKIVAATDRRLSYGGVASDALPGKMFWLGDWLFLYAGTPSHIELVNEEIRKFPPLDRASIYESVLAAYRKAKARFCAHAVLAHYDLSIEEFKGRGLKMLGARVFANLSEQLDLKAEEFNEHLLVIGYGKEDNAGNIFQIGPTTLDSHALTGVAAIGSGAEVAFSTLLLLKQARSSTLADSLYAVSAAKFSAEMSQIGDDKDLVSRSSSMYVTWKRTESDTSGKPPGIFIQAGEIDKLREAWEIYGRPKIPREARPALWPIVSEIRNARSEASRLEDADLRIAAEDEDRSTRRDARRS